MTGDNEGIDERLALGREDMLQCGEIVRKLRLGARPTDHRGNEAVVEHPGYGELAGGDALRLSVGLQFFGDHQRFATPLRLHHASVLAGWPTFMWRRRVGIVLASEHAAGERAIRNNA